jgi:hypothetical protein
MRYFKFLAVLAVVAGGLAIALPALAQEGGGGAFSAVTEYDFEDDLVTGDLVRPDGELIGARKKAKVNTLIRVRKHFIPEMLKSVENL